MRRAFIMLLAVQCGLFGGAVALWYGGIHWNASPSMPRGIWREVADGADVRQGDTVMVCLPSGEFARLALARGYVAAGGCPAGGEPLLKRVLALDGDLVEVTRGGMSVNGLAMPGTAQLAADTAGRPLQPWPTGRSVVESGTVWLVSTRVPNAWDSRYFGPVHSEDVLAAMRPVLVW